MAGAEAPAHVLTLPGGGFSGAARGRVLLSSRREKATAKAWWRKGRWGRGFRRARCLAENVRCFMVFVSFGAACQFCTLVK